MATKSRTVAKPDSDKFIAILAAAKKLFSERGYENTSVRQIVKEANTSMGNLYFYFTNKRCILNVICKEFVSILREQIYKIKELDFRPEVGFALDFKIGYITTIENDKLSKLWLVGRKIPEIYQYSLENKRIRLKTFFQQNILTDEELNNYAIAIQSITDAFFEQKREGNLSQSSAKLSNTIIDFSLRLLGYNQQQIKSAIEEVERYIIQEKIDVNHYFKF